MHFVKLFFIHLLVCPSILLPIHLFTNIYYQIATFLFSLETLERSNLEQSFYAEKWDRQIAGFTHEWICFCCWFFISNRFWFEFTNVTILVIR